MLNHIHIKNFVIVDNLSIDFHQGLHVLTGETGAGKSIWVDAVLLALGSRADNSVVRQGKTQCDITLCFDLSEQTAARNWLATNDFSNEDECIIRRIIKADGKSKSTLNGQPCPQSLIRDFTQHLVLIHGQHQQIALLKNDTQREVLDAFSGLKDKVKQLNEYHKQWQQLQHELKVLAKKIPQREAELDLLNFQLTELQQANIQKDEWLLLMNEYKKCQQAKGLITDISQALEMTTDREETNASLLVQNALNQLNNIDLEDAELNNIRGLLNTASIYLQEASDGLTQFRDSLDLNPEKLTTLEDRLQLIQDLARKHHTQPESLHETQLSLQQKITSLEHIEESFNTIKKASTTITKKYQTLAKEVTTKRKQAANKLNKKITEKIQLLGLKGGQFNIRLQSLAEPINPYGQEKIEFYISTNTGQTEQPMHKIVSGGELSRISLAIQVITAEHTKPPTLIFDEVDVGIGGTTANVVGALLRELGSNTQVLCITHLPQVAATGHHHYQITKEVKSGVTFSSIAKLSQEQRTTEIARMLGGNAKTSQAHAKDMLAVE